MAETLYDYFEIDAADIWQAECTRFRESGGNNPDDMEDTYVFIQELYINNKIKPFLTLADKNTPYYNGYYQKFNDRKKEGLLLSFFYYYGELYDLNEPCVIKRANSNKKDFERIFALKLKQYFDHISFIEDFLQFQLADNFQEDVPAFKKFIKYLLIQYAELLDHKVVGVVKEVMEGIKIEPEPEPDHQSEIAQEGVVLEKTNETSEKDLPDLGVAEENPVSPKDKNTVVEETPIPIGYKVVEGDFNQKEILHYFSFLHEELSVGGEPFLSEDNVNKIFKYGIAIPPKPLKKKYKLNVSKKYPKRYIEDALYIFFSNCYKANSNKLNYLRFFANYIEDFSSALDDEKALQNWNKNVTGGRSRKMKFDAKKYLPESTSESTPESTE